MTSLCPASIRRRTIGPPIMPTPIKPMSMVISPLAVFFRPGLCPSAAAASPVGGGHFLSVKSRIEIIISFLIISLLFEAKDMPKLPIKREIAFTIMDVARMLRTYADQRGRQFGISRAQWVVLIRLDRSEGLKQSELAEIL